MIVADTNLLIYLFIEGERTGESEAVQRRDPVWSAPVLWRSEFRNALIGLVRKGILALDDALPMVDEAERRWLAMNTPSFPATCSCLPIDRAVRLTTVSS